MPDELAQFNPNPLSLDLSILKQLETYEDYVSFYVQLDEATSGFAWLKADMLNQLSNKMGDQTLTAFSRDMHLPVSTVSNYIRTSVAFPPDKRDPGIAFATHFQASYADSYNAKTKTFDSDDRFKWLEKAIDKGWSSRFLAEAIRAFRIKQLPSVCNACNFCGKTVGTDHYYMYSPTRQISKIEFDLHPKCYDEIIKIIKKHAEDNTRISPL